MTSHLDKGILNISYNFLNLPKEILFSEWYIIRNQATGADEQRNVRSAYIYRTDGVKLRKNYTTYFSKGGVERTLTTDYLDGFQYTVNHLGVVSPEFIPTSEGYFNFKNNKYIYNYVDHLGNIRLSYFHNGTGIEVLEENNYYPFGLKHEGYNALDGNTFYQYKYQGQELQNETGWYSFKWRNYMPDLGRFFNVDPLAEKYPYWTPYAFSGNRVVDARELEGLEPVEINKTTKNLVIVNQGWVGNPPKGATQAQNFAKTNKDGGIDYSGIGIINNLNSSTTQVGVFASSKGENTKNDILASIKSFRKQSPDGKLIMVGHSMGADNEVELVNEHPEIKVDLLFTLDIADDPRSGFDDDDIPSNVKTAINYYNKNDGFMHSAVGGEDIEVNDPTKTRGINVPVSAAHTEIDNKYKYNAYNAVVRELNKKGDKKP